ncbi:MAG: arginine deiminase, partial [Gammaproteobacteria bacterium]|nr:arginine deiminase [Gammaproteobacteria bacterium]
MKKINVYSEINPLKAVILHEPGEELNNLTPKYLEELLFDDIPWLPLAKREHKAFAKAFIDNGVTVYYLVDLVVESLKTKEIKDEFIKQFIVDAKIASQTLKDLVYDYLTNIKDNKELVLKCISGIKKTDLGNYKHRTLSDYVNDSPFITNPMPNLYFTRDPFVALGGGVVINKMHSETRRRETIFGDFIFRYNDKFKDVPKYYNRFDDFEIEGGDVLILNSKTLIVGVSQRTSAEAVWALAKNLFYKFNTSFETVLAFSIPKMRSFMHLDTIFTQVDINKFTIHKGCYKELKIYEITK